MGNINSIPVVSQVKSLVQIISGDEEGARQTQEEFSRKGIIVSQVRFLITCFNASRINQCDRVLNKPSKKLFLLEFLKLGLTSLVDCYK